jgi:hypothetical protein
MECVHSFPTAAYAKRCKKKAQPGFIRHAKIRFLYDVDPSATGGDFGIPGHKK